MADQDVSVDPHGKLELTSTDDLAHALDADARKAPKPELPDRATVEEAVTERAVQQEAEQALVAEAREHATSAEPPESGALTVEPPAGD